MVSETLNRVCIYVSYERKGIIYDDNQIVMKFLSHKLFSLDLEVHLYYLRFHNNCYLKIVLDEIYQISRVDYL